MSGYTQGFCMGCEQEFLEDDVIFTAASADFHTGCFKCEMCGHALSKGLYYPGNAAHAGVFCQKCHSRITDKHCPRCKNPVLARCYGDNESLFFHEACFTCEKCSSLLTSKFRRNGDSIYCEKHGPSPSLLVCSSLISQPAPEFAIRRSMHDVQLISAVLLCPGADPKPSPADASSPTRVRYLPLSKLTQPVARAASSRPSTSAPASGSTSPAVLSTRVDFTTSLPLSDVGRKVTRHEDWRTPPGTVVDTSGGDSHSARAHHEIAAAGVNAAERKRVYLEKTSESSVSATSSPALSPRRSSRPSTPTTSSPNGASSTPSTPSNSISNSNSNTHANSNANSNASSPGHSHGLGPHRRSGSGDLGRRQRAARLKKPADALEFDVLDALSEGADSFGLALEGGLDAWSKPKSRPKTKAGSSGKRLDFVIDASTDPTVLCTHCNLRITDLMLVRDNKRVWHLTCFRCTQCDVPLQAQEGGAGAYEEDGQLRCEGCYDESARKRLGFTDLFEEGGKRDKYKDKDSDKDKDRERERDREKERDPAMEEAYREWGMNREMAELSWPENAIAHDEQSMIAAPEWRLELGAPHVNPADVDFSFVDYRRPYYTDVLSQVDHELHFVVGETPAVFVYETKSLVGDGRTKMYRAMMFSQRGEERMVLRADSSKNSRRRAVQESHPLLGEGAELLFVRDGHDALVEDLRAHERKLFKPKLKFGVLYTRPGQRNEDEMYANQGGSAAFDKFLGLLGDRVELVGHVGYAGGLSVMDESNGKHSVYTRFADHEIMFHVSTMIPMTKEDTQGVFRKKFLGNDVVLIVFQDGETKPGEGFNPEAVSSHFNHVFCVVQPVERGDDPRSYRVALTYKHGTRPTKPYLPTPAVFEHGEGMREFLLTKLINGEYAALFGSPEFASAVRKTRRMLLEEIVQKHGTKKVQKAILGEAKTPEGKRRSFKVGKS